VPSSRERRAIRDLAEKLAEADRAALVASGIRVVISGVGAITRRTGRAVPASDEAYIIEIPLRQLSDKGTVRATLAHEFGHITLKHFQASTTMSDAASLQQELDADEFAVGLGYKDDLVGMLTADMANPALAHFLKGKLEQLQQRVSAFKGRGG
jgi:hypothetical protein